MNVDSYSIHIQGPDMDTRFLLEDEQDLAVLALILTKIRKKIDPPAISPAVDPPPVE